MKYHLIKTGAMVLSGTAGLNTNAQLSFLHNYAPGPEFRDGQGSPFLQVPGRRFYIAAHQLIVGFNMYRLKFGLALQDVRVWGQDVSMINRTTTPDNTGSCFMRPGPICC
jgi:hypothetical protein